MWLVLEGINGAGKTRLARFLCKKFGWAYEHVNAERGQWGPLANEWVGWPRGHDVIWDRGHLGEFVYGPSRGHAPGLGETRMMEAVLVDQLGITFWVKRDPADCHRDKVSPFSLEQLREHHLSFESLQRDTRLTIPPVVCDFEPEVVAEVVSTMYERGRKNELLRVSGSISVDLEGVGERQPDVWVLGQGQNPNTPVRVPFSTPCGLELVWPCINPYRVRVSNVLASRGTSSIVDRWLSLGEPDVVCLGKVALDECKAARVPVHASLPHPQYWRRFMSQRMSEYPLTLSDVLVRVLAA
jgi:hypothetical protein